MMVRRVHGHREVTSYMYTLAGLAVNTVEAKGSLYRALHSVVLRV
jgi:hypothetical protein